MNDNEIIVEEMYLDEQYPWSIVAANVGVA